MSLSDPEGGPQASEQDAQPPADRLPTLTDMGKLVKRVGEESPDSLATPIKILLFMTLLSVVPAMLMMMTSFTRILIVLAFIRRALTTRNVPPNQVVVGMSFFLTLFVMAPTFGRINSRAIQPYLAGAIGPEEALHEGVEPLRDFMFAQTSEDDLTFFASLAGVSDPSGREDIPTHVLVPSFVLSELKKAFELGFVLFLPFLIVDLVVASVLLSMGMMMLPPVMISAPLKLLLFVLVDGWRLVAESLVFSFSGAPL